MQLPDTDALDLELSHGWLTIWFNRPETRNALSEDVIDALLDTLARASADETLRGVVLRGRGEVFCAGGDLKGMQASDDPASGRARIIEANMKGGQLFHAFSTVPHPTIIVATGAAMAGGLGLACTADITIGTQDCRFALTETRLGIVPAQIAPYVARRIGLSQARRLMLSGARFDGAQAQRLGILHQTTETTDALEELLTAIKAQIGQCAPAANRATKALLSRIEHQSLEDFRQDAAVTFADALLGEEGTEGVRSFIEKRKPGWASAVGQD